MKTVMSFKDSLDVFRNIITLYRDEEGKLFVGSTFRCGNGKNDEWMSVFHKAPIDENEGLIIGWNTLDDYYPSMRVLPEDHPETGVEDFFYAHGNGRDWKSVDYNIVDSFSEIETYCKQNPIRNGSGAAFGILMPQA